MNTFLKNSLRTLGLLLIINLAACSSSDNDYNDSDNNNAPNEGVWRGLLTLDDDVGAAGAVVDEDDSTDVDVVFADGRVMIITTGDDDDLYMYSGTYEYSDSDGGIIKGDALEYGGGDGFEVGCDDFNCKATGANMSFKGAVDDSGTMHLEFDLKEDDDLVYTGTIQLIFDDEEGSSIDYIEGTWATEPYGLEITVEEDGSFAGSFLKPNGDERACDINGTISMLDLEYNLYDATFEISHCDGDDTKLYNGEYTGFAAVIYGDVLEDDILTIIGSNKQYSFFVDLDY